jgi:hypothetical protein
VADESIFTEREELFLEALVRNQGDFMIVGLSAAALQGAPAVTQDVDLWFRDLNDSGIQRALIEVGGSYVAPQMGHPPRFIGDAVQLFDIVVRMHGLGTFEAEHAGALKIRMNRVVVKTLPLERIIASKKAANREKDKLVLPVLEDAAATIRTEKRRGDSSGRVRRPTPGR